MLVLERSSHCQREKKPPQGGILCVCISPGTDIFFAIRGTTRFEPCDFLCDRAPLLHVTCAYVPAYLGSDGLLQSVPYCSYSSSGALSR